MSHGNVCIVILNMNGKNLLEKCLDSILTKTTYSNFDIIVVDNGSSDGSVSMIQTAYPQAEIIANDENLGFSIANNQALHRHPEYEWYLLLNNDTEVREGWLSAMLATATQKDSVGIVGAKLLYPDGTIQHAGGQVRLRTSEHLHIGHGESQDRFTEDREVEYVTGAAFLINRDVIAEIGYLDEQFSPVYYEEADYCSRATAAGFDIYFSSDAIITHHEGKTATEQVSDYIQFVTKKNLMKYVLLNESWNEVGWHTYKQIRQLGGSLLYRDHPEEHTKIIQELIVDWNSLLVKRMNRSRRIPSYYCEGIKNHMRRYGSSSKVSG